MVDGILERRCAGRGACGGMLSHCLGYQMEQEKIYEKKYTLALDSRQSTTADTTTNQQQAATTEERTERRCNEREARGKHDTIAFRGGEVKRRKKYKMLNKIIIDSDSCRWQ